MLDKAWGMINIWSREKSGDIKFSLIFQVFVMSWFHHGKSLSGVCKVWVWYWSERVLNNIRSNFLFNLKKIIFD